MPLLLAELAVITTGRLAAVELSMPDSKLPAIDVHGFLSQGLLDSSDYNYLGDSSHGSYKFTEAGLNASFNPFPRTRIAAQEFTYDVGPAGNYDVVLDYALVEYTFNDHLGIRAGRIRRPEGLYNDIQDVDLARTWVLLPQGMYNARWRDFYVSEDGAEIFGTFSLNQAGSLSYELYDGLQHPKLDGGLALQKANLPPFSKLTWINSPNLGGGQLWWNTPLEGLKAGLALNYDEGLTFINAAGRQSKGSPITQHYSLEYLRDSWTFQAEYLRFKINYLNTGGGLPASTKLIEPDTWYVSAAYRFNRWFEAGGYYTTYCADVNNRHGKGLQFPSDANQADTALSLRFDVTPWWIFKVEGHYIKGTAQLLDNAANPVRGNNGWSMLAVKTTLSF
ncbi:MAG TPA: hypothetical protein VN877_06605 [Opitutaceae bacterium]|nr:hypothetical protein [Opitutaceae bacterium]